MDSFDWVIEVSQDALWATLQLSLPLLLVGLVVGLAVSVFQAATQIQDQTLTFVPKIVAMVLTMIVLLPLLLDWAVEYTWRTFDQLRVVWEADRVDWLPIETAEAMAAFLLVFFRITGAALSAPFLSSRGFPVQIRIGLVFFLSILMFPLEWGRLADGAMSRLLDDELAAGLTVLSELAIGWTIGWIASVMVFAAQLAGHLLGQEIGFSIGEVLDPASEGQGAITSQLFFMLALVGFVLLGGPDLLVHSIHRSFAVLPPGGVVAAAGLLSGVPVFDPGLLVVDAGGDLWRGGVMMALPGMVGLMLATAAMAILARAVPEMNVFVLGFTIRILLGLFTTWLVLPFIGDVFEAYLEITAGLLGELLGSWQG